MIYFILDEKGNSVKIGKTHSKNSLKKRLIQLQNGNQNQLKIILTIIILRISDEKLEKELHNKFRKHHIRGEWFTYHEEIQAYILTKYEERKSMKKEITLSYNNEITCGLTDGNIIIFDMIK